MRRSAVVRAVMLLCLTWAAAPASAQEPVTSTVLTVEGDVATPLNLSLAMLRTYPRTTVIVEDEGRSVSYEGVLLGEILKRAGAPVCAELRGNNMATYILATARDGYQVIFSLAEVDPGFTSNNVIVADTIDGKPLFDYQGPVRIVAPKDARAARSIRMIERIQVVRVRK